MRAACKEDKQLVVDVISEAFADNPHFDFLLKKKNKQKHIENLAAYAFDVGIRRKGVFITSDNNGIAIVYKSQAGERSLSEFLKSMQLAFASFNLSKIGSIVRHENTLKARRPQTGEYLYCWFFGVRKIGRGRSAPREIRDYIFERSKNEQLPVFAETTLERNKLLFEKFGFQMYDYVENRDHNLKVWLMKRNYN